LETKVSKNIIDLHCKLFKHDIDMQAYVHNYNVYMIPDLAATSPVIMEVSPTNGQKNLIYYGIPSWMYEGN